MGGCGHFNLLYELPLLTVVELNLIWEVQGYGLAPLAHSSHDREKSHLNLFFQLRSYVMISVALYGLFLLISIFYSFFILYLPN